MLPSRTQVEEIGGAFKRKCSMNCLKVEEGPVLASWLAVPCLKVKEGEEPSGEEPSYRLQVSRSCLSY